MIRAATRDLNRLIKNPQLLVVETTFEWQGMSMAAEPPLHGEPNLRVHFGAIFPHDTPLEDAEAFAADLAKNPLIVEAMYVPPPQPASLAPGPIRLHED